MKSKNRICYEEEHNPQIKMEIGGYSYSFTVRDVDENSHEWLLEVISRQMQEVHDRAKANERLDIETKFKEMFNID